MQIRKANKGDIDAVAQIYDEVHTCEELGLLSVGWKRGTYPTRQTAEEAVQRDDLFVAFENDRVIAAAVLNHLQVDCYAQGDWQLQATDKEVLVMHTLVVSPSVGRKGVGRQFVAFYENYARQLGMKALRIDTQTCNQVARSLYHKLGFDERGVVECQFNGISSVQMVLLEKVLV